MDLRHLQSVEELTVESSFFWAKHLFPKLTPALSRQASQDMSDRWTDPKLARNLHNLLDFNAFLFCGRKPIRCFCLCLGGG